MGWASIEPVKAMGGSSESHIISWAVMGVACSDCCGDF